MVSVDLRAAAVFRMSIALLTLLDLFQRSRWTAVHYTSGGLLEADSLRSLMATEPWPLMFLFYFENQAGLLFLAGGVAALLMLVGWRSRLMTLICWLVLVSLQLRNPAILHAGDTLHRLLLFWGMLLPLGARFSVDALLTSGHIRNMTWFSGASFGVVWQVALIYWLTGLLKLTEPSWREGWHLELVLRYQELATPVAPLLLEWPVILSFLTWGTIGVELLVPFLLFSPWRFGVVRTIALGILAAFQIGLLATLEIGLFPLLNLAALLLLLPRWFWIRALRERRRFRLIAGQLRRRLQQGRTDTVPTAPTSLLPGRWLGWVGWVAMAYVTLFNLPSALRPDGPWMLPGYWVRLDQNWRVFLQPAPETGRVVVVGFDSEGRQQVLFVNDPDEPSDLGYYRWRFFHGHLVRAPDRFGPLQERYARWRANVAEESGQMEGITGLQLLYLHQTLTPGKPDGPPTLRRLREVDL